MPSQAAGNHETWPARGERARSSCGSVPLNSAEEVSGGAGQLGAARPPDPRRRDRRPTGRVGSDPCWPSHESSRACPRRAGRTRVRPGPGWPARRRGHRSRLRVRRGTGPSACESGDLGYDSSRSLRSDVRRSKGLRGNRPRHPVSRFVGRPPWRAGCAVRVQPRTAAGRDSVQGALLREIDPKIGTAFPPASSPVQWESPPEFAILEGAMEYRIRRCRKRADCADHRNWANAGALPARCSSGLTCATALRSTGT